MESSLNLPCLLDVESTIREWLDDPKGKVVFGPMYEKMRQRMKTAFGSDSGASDDIGMDATGFMMEMPLLSILQFQESALPKPAHEIVNDLLQQVHGR